MPWLWPWEVWYRQKCIWDEMAALQEAIERLEDYLDIKKGYAKKDKKDE